jgi:hypothetical protein
MAAGGDVSGAGRDQLRHHGTPVGRSGVRSAGDVTRGARPDGAFADGAALGWVLIGERWTGCGEEVGGFGKGGRTAIILLRTGRSQLEAAMSHLRPRWPLYADVGRRPLRRQNAEAAIAKTRAGHRQTSGLSKNGFTDQVCPRSVGTTAECFGRTNPRGNRLFLRFVGLCDHVVP